MAMIEGEGLSKTREVSNRPEHQAIERAIAATPARILVGRAGPAYRTITWLKLREDHAAARDAVYADIDLDRDFGEQRIAKYDLFEVKTKVSSKAEFLRRPDLGRKIADDSRDQIRSRCSPGADLQVIVGDGLSATAVAVQAPVLLDELYERAFSRGLTVGNPFLIRYCRVGVMNEIGELLLPRVVVLLIGERPGLATAESLSAYLAYKPRHGHTDADRNLISNIHQRGIHPADAAVRIMALAEQFCILERSGVGITEAPIALPGRMEVNISASVGREALQQ